MEKYGFAIREGFRNFRRGRTLSFAMMGCIAVAVFAIGAFGLFAFNISSMLKRWESRVELVAFLAHDLDDRETQQALNEVRRIPEVGEARLITSRESWEELFSEVRSLELDEAPIEKVLPTSVVIRLAQGKRNLAAIRHVAARIASLNNVDDVKFEEVLLERYLQLRRDLTLFTTAASVFWTLLFGVITVSIAKLASTARKGEVHTLRMLGASTKFVRRIFTVEGIAQGVSGSVVGIGLLVVVTMFLSSRMESALQFPMKLFAVASVVGPILGLLASWFLFRNALAPILAIILAAVPANAFAAQEESLEAELIRYQHELERVEHELQQSRNAAEKLSGEEHALIDELEGADKSIESLAREIKEGEARIATNKAAIEETQADLGRYEDEFERSGRELEQWLKLLCNSREPTMIEVIIYDIPQSKMTRRREMISLLAKEQAETLKNTERLRMAVLSRRETLSKRLELDALHTKTAKLRAEQSVKKKEQRQDLLKKLRGQKDVYMAAINDLEISARRLQEMIETQREDRNAVFAGSAPFREMKGLLPWPAEGEIALSFGRMKNPDSHTYTRHLGIDIKTAAGSEIRAVHDAFVAYCDWFRGYGKLVILDHGDGYNSVYAHCSEMLVQKGDMVRAGQPIALVGETGSLKGPFLYFEIRENGQPVDPAVWFQRRILNATQ